MRKTPEALAQVLNEAVALHQRGDVASAERLYRKVIAAKPGHFHATHLLGVLSFQCGRHQEAERLIKRALLTNPDDETAHYHLAMVMKDLGRFQEALDSIDRAIALKPKYIEAYNNRGVILQDLKRPAEAVESYDRAIALNPGYFEAHYNRGNAFKDLEAFERALECFDRTIALRPDFFDAYLNRANALKSLERHDEALAAYDRVLSIKPKLAEAWISRGTIFFELKRFHESAAAYDQALAINANLAEAWLGRGNAYFALDLYDDAGAAYGKAIAIKPDLVQAWAGCANVLSAIKRYSEALSAYDKALALEPDLATAWQGRGIILSALKRRDEAFDAYDKAFAIQPDLPGLEGMRLFAKMSLCDWRSFYNDRENLCNSLNSGELNVDPFVFLAISNSAEDQKKCAELWVAKSHPDRPKPVWQGEIYKHEKIRVAYVSADFREHPVSHLIANMFECHDKSRFEITALAIGAEDNSEMRQRLRGAFERFIDARTYSDDRIAAEIKNLEIDLLVDLNGYTLDARTGIFSRRPAPVQINYLGYPGTTALDYMDYLIADRTTIPEVDRPYYTEKLVYLPDSYLPNSHRADEARRPIADELTRQEFGLPERGFVFCCFNENYKIMPDVFNCWMEILKQTEKSVLWMREPHNVAIENLRNEAMARGIGAERLIFAKRIALADHLKRHRLADLFLDTLPYNAHTTASDALWAGLPVLTQIGDTFAGRVAASLLNAVGLPELIVETQDQYRSAAIELASNPAKLAAIRAKLAQNRLTTPLFDTPLFTRHIETAFEAMYDRYQKGLSPDHIAVPR